MQSTKTKISVFAISAGFGLASGRLTGEYVSDPVSEVDWGQILVVFFFLLLVPAFVRLIELVVVRLTTLIARLTHRERTPAEILFSGFSEWILPCLAFYILFFGAGHLLHNRWVIQEDDGGFYDNDYMAGGGGLLLGLITCHWLFRKSSSHSEVAT